jgi:hypothetical protein
MDTYKVAHKILAALQEHLGGDLSDCDDDLVEVIVDILDEEE